jgi:hypothetical protein
VKGDPPEIIKSSSLLGGHGPGNIMYHTWEGRHQAVVRQAGWQGVGIPLRGRNSSSKILTYPTRWAAWMAESECFSVELLSQCVRV